MFFQGALKKKLRSALLILSAFIGFRSKKIYITNRCLSNDTGPTRFLYNITRYLVKNGISIEYTFLGRASTALIIICPPFRFFYDLCKARNIKTVLRIDGIYLPSYFDGIEYENRKKRDFDFVKIETNQDIQYGLYKADWIVYQSNFSKEMADKYLFKRISKFSVIYNGVDIDHFKPFPQNKSNRIVVMLLGSWRDIDILLCSLEAFRFFNETNKNTELKILGEMTRDINSILAKRIKSYSLQNYVTLTGKISYADLPSEINKCDVSLHLKSGDWCPNAVLETMSCGVPVICHGHGGTRELVRDRRLIIDHYQFSYDLSLSKKASDKLCLVVESLSYYKLNARKTVETKFTLEKSGHEYAKILSTGSVLSPHDSNVA
jgi:glycosyltransferase involved in cell wall biosynthesis